MEFKNRKLHSCPIERCMKIFTSALDLEKHLKLHSEECLLSCKCPGCEYEFSKTDCVEVRVLCLISQDLSEAGVETSDLKKKKLHICNFKNCEKTFSSPSLLEIHLRSHTDERPFVCERDACGKKFKTKGQLKTHGLSHARKNHSGSRKKSKNLHSCTYCDKNFNFASQLEIHARRHTGERPFSCKQSNCGKKFKTKGQLTSHMVVHTGEKKFICDVCDHRFGQKAELIRHLDVHARKGPQPTFHRKKINCSCPNCKSKDNDKIDEDAKVQSHESDKNVEGALILERRLEETSREQVFICEWEKCEEEFTQEGDLRAHKLTHKKGKNYSCDTSTLKSSRTKTQEDDLKTQKLTLKKGKNYSCDISTLKSSRTRTQEDDLKTQKLTLKKGKNYSCDIPTLKNIRTKNSQSININLNININN